MVEVLEFRANFNPLLIEWFRMFLGLGIRMETHLQLAALGAPLAAPVRNL